jgi:hypothetical protein
MSVECVGSAVACGGAACDVWKSIFDDLGCCFACEKSSDVTAMFTDRPALCTSASNHQTKRQKSISRRLRRPIRPLAALVAVAVAVASFVVNVVAESMAIIAKVAASNKSSKDETVLASGIVTVAVKWSM